MKKQNNKKDLGKPEDSPLPNMRTEVRILPISRLIVSEANVRKEYINWEDLLPSIEKDGIREPIHVWFNRETSMYEIMDGQNRYHCAKHLGISEIECIVHLDITTLQEAKKWCRCKAITLKDISINDKRQIAIDLMEEYGELKTGCESEGLSYDKLKEWARIPEECLPYKIPLRAIREISGINDPNRRTMLSRECHNKTLNEAMEIIRRFKAEWIEVDDPPKKPTPWRLFPEDDAVTYQVWKYLKRKDKRRFRALINIKDQTPEENARELNYYIQLPERMKNQIHHLVVYDNAYIDVEYRYRLSKNKVELWKLPPIPKVIQEKLNKRKWDRSRFFTALMNGLVLRLWDLTDEQLEESSKEYYKLLSEEWGVPISEVRKHLEE